MPDPNTSTRAEFTASYLAIAPLPTDPNVSAKWTRLVRLPVAARRADLSWPQSQRSAGHVG